MEAFFTDWSSYQEGSDDVEWIPDSINASSQQYAEMIYFSVEIGGTELAYWIHQDPHEVSFDWVHEQISISEFSIEKNGWGALNVQDWVSKAESVVNSDTRIENIYSNEIPSLEEEYVEDRNIKQPLGVDMATYENDKPLESCDRCEFWDRIERLVLEGGEVVHTGSLGNCVRYPPVMHWDPQYQVWPTYYPETGEGNWCGEFKWRKAERTRI